MFLGAGEAGLGIAELLTRALVAAGVPEPVARRQCWFWDSKGLVTVLEDGAEAPKAFMPEATDLAERFAQKVGGVTATFSPLATYLRPATNYSRLRV